MVRYKATIEQFREKGEKSGWTYIEVPLDIAGQLYPGQKKAFRVKGSLDSVVFGAISLTPMGEGTFILALKAALRKKLRKGAGQTLEVFLELDEQDPPLSELLLECLKEDQAANTYFKTLPRSHQRYFSNWIEEAKTDATKSKRIGQALNGLGAKMNFGEMIRFYKNKQKE